VNFPDGFVNYLKHLKILYDNGISLDCIDIIISFLEVAEDRRLGFGPLGSANVKKHQFLREIQWELLEQRHVIPPYKPLPQLLRQSSVFSSVEDALISLGKINWLAELPSRSEQSFFKNW
jgi:hypothetical protein